MSAFELFKKKTTQKLTCFCHLIVFVLLNYLKIQLKVYALLHIC